MPISQLIRRLTDSESSQGRGSSSCQRACLASLNYLILLNVSTSYHQRNHWLGGHHQGHFLQCLLPDRPQSAPHFLSWRHRSQSNRKVRQYVTDCALMESAKSRLSSCLLTILMLKFSSSMRFCGFKSLCIISRPCMYSSVCTNWAV